jgi:NAD(P)-dependent dehydrogenase (short-subunit alcohol dehydrogenase family)
VRELATAVRETTDGLDLLVNNAGGLFRNGAVTDAGIEYTFHVNHLSPYLLTAELLDHLTADARIVTTASEAHKGATLDLDRVRGEDRHSGLKAYSHSKLANILFTRELARRLAAGERTITANCLHPGAIPGSGFVRFLPGPLPGLARRLDGLPGVTAVADGAAEILHLAVAPEVGGVSGEYFASQKPTTPSAAASDDTAARRLWIESAHLLDIEEPLAGDTTTDEQTTASDS